MSSPPAGATQYSLAECNVTSATPNDWVRDCNQLSGTTFTSLSTTTRTITVNNTFTNYSYIPGQPPLQGMFTTCRGVPTLRPCAVVLSWFNSTFDLIAGAATVRLTF